MRIIGERSPDDCVDTGFIKVYLLNEKVTEDFLKFLQNFGELQILDGIREPFYTVDKEYFFTLKGLVGKMEMKVVYRKDRMDEAKGFIETLMRCYSMKDGGRGLEEAKAAERKIKEKIL